MTTRTRNEMEADLLYGNECKFGIYQLKDTDMLRYFRFSSLQQLEMDGLTIDRANYELVYIAPLLICDTQTNLHKIFLTLNANPPDDFNGRSVSVSDVIILQWKGKVSAYYVDSCGFERVSDFFNHTVLSADDDNAAGKGATE